MKIGVALKSYPIIRNVFEKIPEADYVVLRKNNNLFHGLSTLSKLILRKPREHEGKYFFYQGPKIEILHLYNDINYSSQKWVSTFETLVPRFLETKNDQQKTEPLHQRNSKTEKALKIISKKNCLGIIAISKASADIQRELLKHYPHYQASIEKKLHIIHPPQPVIANEKIYPKNGDLLNFIFVGNQFHLKGGWEMYEVLKNMRKIYDFRLTVISSFKTDHYVTKVTQKEAEEAHNTLKSENWIDIYNNIPNNEVLELIKRSHIGLLPTWSDTYGFSVLEMQAAGVPVITTDIRALPEINNTECGWMIQLPKNRLRQALYFSEEQKDNLKTRLKLQLEKILIDIFEDFGKIEEKGKKSLARIKSHHDPERFAEKLRAIYQQ